MRSLYIKVEDAILQFFNKNAKKGISFIPFFMWLSFTNYLLFKPSSGRTKSAWLQLLSEWQVDKLVHGSLFFWLIVLLTIPLYFIYKQKGWLVYTLVLFIAWAFITEWIQLAFVPNRDFDLYDSLADCIGLLLGSLYFNKRIAVDKQGQ